MSDDSSNGSAELLDVPSNEVARKRSPGKDDSNVVLKHGRKSSPTPRAVASSSSPVTLTTLKKRIQLLEKEVYRLEQQDYAQSKELKKLRYEKKELTLEKKTFQAIIRQYRCKLKKIRKLAMAGISREDNLLEYANGKVEDGHLLENITMKSDVEDEHERNRVEYSYIDNELFINEN